VEGKFSDIEESRKHIEWEIGRKICCIDEGLQAD